MSDESRHTDVNEILQDMDAGVFLQKLGRAFSEVAGGVVDHNEKGKLILQFDFSQVGGTHQVHITHKLVYTVPTANGKVVEEDITSTVLQVNRGGKLTFAPENQATMFDSRGAIQQSEGDK